MSETSYGRIKHIADENNQHNRTSRILQVREYLLRNKKLYLKNLTIDSKNHLKRTGSKPPKNKYRRALKIHHNQKSEILRKRMNEISSRNFQQNFEN